MTGFIAGRRERVLGASMPAWHIESELDLRSSALFGSEPALETLRALIGPQPTDQTQASQVAVASFTRTGFEAAAVTGFAVAVSAPRPSLGRAATLRFDHPYAAVAVGGGLRGAESRFDRLPLFTAWVSEPAEAEEG
jgi:hypothetical protein